MKADRPGFAHRPAIFGKSGTDIGAGAVVAVVGHGLDDQGHPGRGRTALSSEISS